MQNSDDQRRQGSGRTRRLAFILFLGMVALAIWFGLPWAKRAFFAGNFDFTALEEPAGFRHLAGGDVSGGLDPVTGLLGAGAGGEGGGRAGTPAEIAPENLCTALFGDGDDTASIDGADGILPIAYFSDYRCPYCRILSKRLEALEQAREDIRIIWHEWPIFGQVSEQAARAALAAKRQGAHGAFHTRLMRSSFIPTEGYLRTLADQAGIDPDRLLADMEGDDVARELARTGALARIFGFRGTPALVVGRTIIVGAIDDVRLDALIDRELADGPSPACNAEAAGGQNLP